MRPVRILEEVHRNQWAMTLPSLRAMLSVLDGEDLSADDYRYFHALEQDKKLEMVDNFGRSVDGSSYSSIDRNVGFLMVDGPIIPRATWFSQVSGMVSLDVLTSEFKALEANDKIDTILILADSPGGAVSGVSDFASIVKASEKRIVSFTWMAASAMYEIVSASDEIISPDSGINGSIGTVISLTDYSEQDKKRGIKQVEIVSNQSPNKRPDVATPEGRAVYQQLVDDLSEQFISLVAENRGTTVEDVMENFGQGAMFVARRALEVGMIDGISDADSLVKSLIKEDNIYSFNNSARAEQLEGMTMAVNKNTPLTAAEMRENNPAAVEEIEAAAKAAGIKEGEASGVESESTRIQNIEALKLKFGNALPAVKAAANAAIDDGKWKAGATAENMATSLLGVVSRAQTGAVEDFAKGPRAAADVAAHASATAPEIKTEADKNAPDGDRVTGMLAAAKAEGRIK